MHIKKKVLFLLICITLLSLTLSGCYDLGDGTEDEEDYCEAYSEIRVISGADTVTYYTMEDFYNKEAVNEFVSPMEEDERKEYSYLLIKVDKDLSIGDIAVHFDSTEEETLSVSFFCLEESEIPTKIYTGPSGKYRIDESDEPDTGKAIGKATCKLVGTADNWNAVWQRSWSVNGTERKRYGFKSGQYIVIRIDNNCYDPALSAYESAEAEWNRVKEEYDTKYAEWQAVNNDSGSSQEQRNQAMAALSQATTAKTVAERDYEEARRQYEINKFPYNRVSVRMTAILIYAE